MLKENEWKERKVTDDLPVSIPHWLLCSHDVIWLRGISLQKRADYAGWTLLPRNVAEQVLPLVTAIRLFSSLSKKGQSRSTASDGGT